MSLTPEARQREIERYGRGYNDLLLALQDFPPTMHRFKPSPSEWSIHEMLIHLPDSETNSFGRFRAAIAEPGARIFAYDQDRWAQVLNYHAQNTQDALDLLRLLRKMTYDLLKTLPLDGEVWAQSIEHPENGRMTLDDVLLSYANHIPDHIAQMRAVHAVWQAEGN